MRIDPHATAVIYLLLYGCSGAQGVGMGANCWEVCSGGGRCSSCGTNGACCRTGFDPTDADCHWGARGCTGYHCCVDMREHPPPPLLPLPPPPPPPPPLLNEGAACWNECDGNGFCASHCGGGACCQAEKWDDPAECGYGSVGCIGQHCCTAPALLDPPTLSPGAGTVSQSNASHGGAPRCEDLSNCQELDDGRPMSSNSQNLRSWLLHVLKRRYADDVLASLAKEEVEDLNDLRLFATLPRFEKCGLTALNVAKIRTALRKESSPTSRRGAGHPPTHHDMAPTAIEAAAPTTPLPTSTLADIDIKAQQAVLLANFGDEAVEAARPRVGAAEAEAAAATSAHLGIPCRDGGRFVRNTEDNTLSFKTFRCAKNSEDAGLRPHRQSTRGSVVSRQQHPVHHGVVRKRHEATGQTLKWHGLRILMAIVADSGATTRSRVWHSMLHTEGTYAEHRARVDWAICAYDDGADAWQSDQQQADAQFRHVRLLTVINASTAGQPALSSGARRAKSAHRRTVVMAAWRTFGQDAWDAVWINDADISLSAYDPAGSTVSSYSLVNFSWATFLERRACAHVGGAPLIVQPTIRQSTQCWPYNHRTYDVGAQAVQSPHKPQNRRFWPSLIMLRLRWVEQQSVMMDATFLRWFYELPLLKRVLELQQRHHVSWGTDAIWCGAAMEYRRRVQPTPRAACAVVTVPVNHANTRSLGARDGEYIGNGMKLLEESGIATQGCLAKTTLPMGCKEQSHRWWSPFAVQVCRAARPFSQSGLQHVARCASTQLVDGCATGTAAAHAEDECDELQPLFAHLNGSRESGRQRLRSQRRVWVPKPAQGRQTITFGTPSRTNCACTTIPFECLVLYDSMKRCDERANHKYVMYHGTRDNGQLLKTMRLFREMLAWKADSDLYFKVDDDACGLKIYQQPFLPCYIGKSTGARYPASFEYAAGPAYGISHHVAQKLQSVDLFSALLEYSTHFQRLRTPEYLNKVDEDAFMGYFARYYMKCNISETIVYRHKAQCDRDKAQGVSRLAQILILAEHRRKDVVAQ